MKRKKLASQDVDAHASKILAASQPEIVIIDRQRVSEILSLASLASEKHTPHSLPISVQIATSAKKQGLEARNLSGASKFKKKVRI